MIADLKFGGKPILKNGEIKGLGPVIRTPWVSGIIEGWLKLLPPGGRNKSFILKQARNPDPNMVDLRARGPLIQDHSNEESNRLWLMSSPLGGRMLIAQRVCAHAETQRGIR